MRRDREQPARRLDAADPRHADVHDDDVGQQLGRSAHGIVAAARLRDHGEAVLLADQAAQAGAKEVVIVDDQHADGLLFGRP